RTGFSVTDAINGVIGATIVTVTPGPAVAVALSNFNRVDNSGSPSDAAPICSPRTLWVSALDTYGNIATTYNGTVHFTSNDPLAQLPTDCAFTASDQGVHAFNVAFGTIGSEQVTVTDGSFSDSFSTLTRSTDFFGLQMSLGSTDIVAGQPVNLTVVAV